MKTSYAMMQLASMRLLGLGVLLAGAIAFELTGTAIDGSTTVGDALLAARPNPAKPLPAPQGNQQVLAADILARPLFAATRRPTAAVAVAASPRATLPRLAGTLVNGGSRSAIFAAVSEGRPVVVQEGAQVSGYTVQRIETGKVTLSGVDGQKVLRPTFDKRPQDANGPVVAGSAIRAILPFVAGTDVLEPLRGLSGFAGTAAR